jgi:hypothetical protein
MFYSTVVLARCEKAWACCLTPLEGDGHYPLSLMNQLLLEPPSLNATSSSSSPIQGSHISPGSPLTDLEEDSFHEDIPPLNLAWTTRDDDLIIINTQFDPEDPINKQPPFQEHDAEFILEWTRKERKKAELAKAVENVDDLKSRVSNPFMKTTFCGIK